MNATPNAAMHADAAAPRRGLSSRAWWPAAKRVLTVTFFLLVAALLIEQARHVDAAAVAEAMQAYRLPTLLAALGLAVASHAIYCTYDLIGRQQTGHGLRAHQVAGVGFISYAFNLNLGSLIGGVAFRYRLYSRLGLSTDVITRVLVLSLLTNWMGYLCLAGLVFLLRPLALPADWPIDSQGLQVLGGVLLLVAATYVGACFRTKRGWRWRGHAVQLPPGRIALLQILLSVCNWALIASISYVLLHQHIDYFSVLSVLLIAAVAGVITHVPAGLGVLEAVFLALLASHAPASELLAALLAYRAIYYLVPLALAGVLFFLIEGRQRRRLATTTR